MVTNKPVGTGFRPPTGASAKPASTTGGSVPAAKQAGLTSSAVKPAPVLKSPVNSNLAGPSSDIFTRTSTPTNTGAATKPAPLPTASSLGYPTSATNAGNASSVQQPARAATPPTAGNAGNAGTANKPASAITAGNAGTVAKPAGAGAASKPASAGNAGNAFKPAAKPASKPSAPPAPAPPSGGGNAGGAGNSGNSKKKGGEQDAQDDGATNVFSGASGSGGGGKKMFSDLGGAVGTEPPPKPKTQSAESSGNAGNAGGAGAPAAAASGGAPAGGGGAAAGGAGTSNAALAGATGEVDPQKLQQAAGGDPQLQATLEKIAQDPEGAKALQVALDKGTTFKVGNFPGSKAGETRTGNGPPQITVEDPNNIDTVAHELAHAAFPDMAHPDVYEFGHRVAENLGAKPIQGPPGLDPRSGPVNRNAGGNAAEDLSGVASAHAGGDGCSQCRAAMGAQPA